MKYFALLLLLACSTSRNFVNKDVCFLIYDLKEEKFLTRYNGSNCNVELPAASTFKIPLSLMAFDSGVLKDEKTEFKWNGQKYFLDSWNKDQTAASWMKESVVWVSQEITPNLGIQKIQKYLADFKYGNQNMSGGIKTAWLTPAPITGEVKENSLKISGYQQVEFLAKFWNGKLPVSAHATEMTKKILVHETNPPHRFLDGKTGSGFIDAEQTKRLGWYVAHLAVGLKNYIVVTNFVDTKEVPQPRGFGGIEAKEITKQLLSEQDLW